MLGVTFNEYLIYWIVGGGLFLWAVIVFLYHFFKGDI